MPSSTYSPWPVEPSAWAALREQQRPTSPPSAPLEEALPAPKLTPVATVEPESAVEPASSADPVQAAPELPPLEDTPIFRELRATLMPNYPAGD